MSKAAAPPDTAEAPDMAGWLMQPKRADAAKDTGEQNLNKLLKITGTNTLDRDLRAWNSAGKFATDFDLQRPVLVPPRF